MKPTKYAKLFNLQLDREDLLENMKLENMKRIKDMEIKPIKGDIWNFIVRNIKNE